MTYEDIELKLKNLIHSVTTKSLVLQDQDQLDSILNIKQEGSTILSLFNPDEVLWELNRDVSESFINLMV